MTYISVKEAASRKGISVRRIQQMCKAGEVPGVIKVGHSWLIPDEGTASMQVSEELFLPTLKSLPIGISDFKTAVTEYYYVDKTLMIRDFLDNRPNVSRFTRPRRFGKTLNMDMLRVFFERSEEDTSVYFKNKKIWSCGEQYRAYQGKYPVIFFTFKDVKCSSWEETFRQVRELIAEEYQRHMEILTGDSLNVYEKEKFSMFMEETAASVNYQSSLRFLSKLLHKYYGEKTIIIIDEYDTPIQQGYLCGFYTEIVNFMRNFFSGGLKDNSDLAYGFLTGILRIARESIFSELNNLKIYSLLDDAYSEYFGFTEPEVKEMLKYYHASDKYDEVCRWYDGYLFGNTELFNPWSVINYIADKCFPEAFWQSTGSNDIVGEIIALDTPEIKEDLYKLLNGESITAYIDTSVIYPEIQKDPYSIYSFLLVSGYLRVSAIYPQHDGNFMCDVGIPNKEILYVYEKEILNKTNQNSMAMAVSQAVFSGDAEKLQRLIDKFMIESISSFDGANEGFYHGMMLGLCAVVSNRYKIRLNRESGLGRFDIMLLPRDKSLPGFIYEIKHTKDESADLNALAEAALEQIDDKKYDAELRDSGAGNIVKVGIAFRGKNAVVKSKQ